MHFCIFYILQIYNKKPFIIFFPKSILIEVYIYIIFFDNCIKLINIIEINFYNLFFYKILHLNKY
jgi:hypothetical protein